jgi:membrane protein DedA with SNARE-associated domain
VFDLKTIYFAVCIFAALVGAGMGVPIPEELPILTAGAVAGHAAEKPEPQFVFADELEGLTDEERARKIAGAFGAMIAFAPDGGVPAGVPWAALATNTRTVVPYQSPMPWWFLLPVCILGVVISDGLLYGIGRFWGLKVIKIRWMRRLLPPDRLERIELNFQKYGVLILLFARVLPGIRSPIFLTAGIMRLPIKKFVLADGIYAIPGVSLLFFLSYMLMDQFKDLVIRKVESARPIIVISVLIGVTAYLILHFRKRPVVTGDPHELPFGDQVAATIEHFEHKPVAETQEKPSEQSEQKPAIPLDGRLASPNGPLPKPHSESESEKKKASSDAEASPE